MRFSTEIRPLLKVDFDIKLSLRVSSTKSFTKMSLLSRVFSKNAGVGPGGVGGEISFSIV